MTPEQIGRMLAEFERRLARVENSPRLSHAALDNTNLVVKDALGTVRGRVGMQDDGTIGLIAVDGPAPGAPSAPVVTSSIGGLRVVWDGTLADGNPLPSDFDHIAVHVATSSGFTPSAATFVGTITKAGDGGMLPVIPLPYQAHYVRLTAVNTSAAVSDPSEETAATPTQVEGADLQAGSVTAGAIAAGAVTAEKLEAVLQLATRLVAGDPDGARVELNEDGLRVYNDTDELVIRFDAADGDATFTGTITGSTVTGGLIQTALSGARITLNEANANEIIIYNEDDVAIGELSPQGLLVKGESGAVMWLNPNLPYPAVQLYNSSGSNVAAVAVSELTPGDANLELVSGTFPANGYTKMLWRSGLFRDAAVIERLALDSTPPLRVIGGRIFMDGTLANLGYVNQDNTAQNTSYIVEPNLATLGNGRLAMTPPASTFSGLYVQAASAHTGPLLRLYRDTDKFSVDKDGNTSVAGRVKPFTGESGTLSLQSGWTNYDATNYGTATVRKSANGTAYLFGRLQAGTATNGTLVATLPNSSYWPLVRHPFPHRAPQGGVDVTLLVNEIGELRIYDISGTVTNLSLAGISWPLW
ncbi:hypothetical protein DMH12_15440 [Streptomyces sp. WAC 04229]|uniref:hypothetical protein n=1 Tax=Streptomyces sp. WAC 04229 TaxID=2203206 RepID=UPI000F73F088|nr:hypothetical protein [Streptomyces sp. WAC 04229]RSN55609.1 hypothetical protein DMH12_15440 [Streptomyces sp. WAC 04229]